MLNIRFDGTDTSVMVAQSGEGTEVGQEGDFGDNLEKMYKYQLMISRCKHHLE